MTTRRQVLRAAAAASSLLAAGPLLAGAIGNGAAARFIVPYPPGGPTDVLARMLGQGLGERWKQPVVIDCLPGAGTMIGVAQVARSAPDGLTFGIVNSAFPVNSIIKKTPYDTFKDLTGITQIADVPLALVANASMPFNTVPEMVAYAKKNPGKLSFASPGAGGTSHLAGELLNRVAGIDLLHVAYKGSAPAQTEVIGGQVQMMIDPLLSVLPNVKAGKLKILAVLSAKRVPGGEQYPVVAETYPGFEVSTFLGLIAPAATPRAVIDRIATDAAAVMNDPREAGRIADLGMYPSAHGPEAFNKLLHAEVAKWSKVIREAKLKLD